METATAKSGSRTIERLTQTAAALARLLDQAMSDIRTLETELQEQALESRAQTTVELEARFEAEKAAALETVHADKTAALEALRADKTAALEALRAEKAAALEALRRELTAQWDSEKAQLVADCDNANRLLEQSRNEHSRAMAESDEAAAIALERQIARAVDRVRAELTSRFDADRNKLVAERNRAQQRLAEAASEFEHQAEQAKHASAAKPAEATSGNAMLIRNEVARVEGLIKKISEAIEDPETELSVVIRKNAERAELESYLRGLRFKI